MYAGDELGRGVAKVQGVIILKLIIKLDSFSVKIVQGIYNNPLLNRLAP